MSGTQGMQGGMGMQNSGYNGGMGSRMAMGGQLPQGAPANTGVVPQPANMPGMGMQQPHNQMPQAIPPGLGGGQMPVQMGQNPYQYGVPQTSNYVDQQAQQRMLNRV